MGRKGAENRKLQEQMFPGEEYTFLTAPEYLTVSSKVCKGSNCISLILLFFVQTALYFVCRWLDIYSTATLLAAALTHKTNSAQVKRCDHWDRRTPNLFSGPQSRISKYFRTEIHSPVLKKYRYCVDVCMCGFCNVWVCMCGFCNVCVCVCVGFVMCGCVYVWVL